MREAVRIDCDRPRCPASIVVRRRPGYWRFQPQQEAENLGWSLSARGDYCPPDDPFQPAP